MPERGRMHRERSPELWYRNRCLDMKYVGVPGEARVTGGVWGKKSLRVWQPARQERVDWAWQEEARRQGTAGSRCPLNTLLAVPNPAPIPPGIVNFIDARTQWIDDGVKRALDDGFEQVGAEAKRAAPLLSLQHLPPFTAARLPPAPAAPARPVQPTPPPAPLSPPGGRHRGGL
jgi:hypothetical protein